MLFKCSSNSKRDLGKTIQGLGVDLYSFTTTRKIPNSVSEVVYNSITDVSSIGFRINDNFDLLRLSQSLSLNASNTGNTPSGSTGASQTVTDNI